MNVVKIQSLLKEYKIDGWLFIDSGNRDSIGGRILGLDSNRLRTRRWAVWVPKKGEVIRIVSLVEEYALEGLPGHKILYCSWKEFHNQLKSILDDVDTVAMQYSKMNDIPDISIVDGGTIELIRSCKVEIITSANLVQRMEAVIDEDGFIRHKQTGKIIDEIRREAFEEIARNLKANKKIDENALRKWIGQRFEEERLTCDGNMPIVAVNENSSDPHYEPRKSKSRIIKKGDFVLIDLWARQDNEKGIYYDITWCGYVGKQPKKLQQEVFDIVRKARDTAVSFIEKKFTAGHPCSGNEVDDACRKVIIDAGYGKYFVHRTGHCIGREVHGSGVNIDNKETRDSRLIIPGICFSIEPGIYLRGKFGVRSEINMFIRHDGVPEITGEVQNELVKIG